MSTLAAGETPAAAAPPTWRAAAIEVLSVTGRPMRAKEIVEYATQVGLRPPSTTRTPDRSVSRDLHAVIRGGGPVVALAPGLFVCAEAAAAHAGRYAPARTRSTVRLPAEPLVAAVEARGGLAECGLSRAGTPAHPRAGAYRRLYERSRARGWIGLFDADELAVKVLGVHPCRVWDDGWWEANAHADEIARTTAQHPPRPAGVPALAAAQ